MEFTIFGNGLEIEMTLEQAKSMSHSGDCEADVRAAIADGLAKQLEGKEEDVRLELAECGAWEDDELKDDELNAMRILWLAANNIMEEKVTGV